MDEFILDRDKAIDIMCAIEMVLDNGEIISEDFRENLFSLHLQLQNKFIGRELYIIDKVEG